MYDWPTHCMVVRACVIALVLLGCDSAEPVGPEQPQEPLQGLRMEPLSDTTQTATVGTRSHSLPAVRLTTPDGNPAAGREVRFLASGGGSIEFASQRTDTAGMASPGAWTLGTTAGRQTVTARTDGVADLVFSALAEAGRPVSIEIIAGNHQTAAPGASLPTALQVKLADQYGNPVPDELVAFAQMIGGGSILGDSARSDSLGYAMSGIWTLGDPGPQVVKARIAGRELFFEAFACGDPCRGRDLLYVRGDNVYSLVNGVTTLLMEGEPGLTEVALSPDGQRIAFTVYDWSIDGVDLYVMNADGSNRAWRSSELFSPSWSPDGRQLAVAGYDSNSGRYGVFTLSLEEADAPPVLLKAGATEPAWSPDGTKIAFVENDGSGLLGLGVMNADGTAVTALVSRDKSGFWHPSWSPDGQRLAFQKCDGLGEWEPSVCDIFTITVSGADVFQLSYTGDAWHPAWSPDGSRIAFSLPGGTVWLPADGSITQPLSLVPDGYSLAWRP